MIQRALQTITWGDPQDDRFAAIFSHAANAGFQGVEIGFRRLRQVEPERMQALLAEANLTLSASHIGGNLENPAQAAAEGLAIDDAISYLKHIGCPLLLQSGLREARGADLDAAIAQLNEQAKRAADQGIALCYHNHDWEFADNACIYQRLLDEACPELCFAPDLGWAARAGKDLTALLNELDGRLKVLHFKDFGNIDGNVDTVHLGTGTITFDAAWKWLQDHREWGGWVTAEQDRAHDPDAAAKANGAWLQQQVEGMAHV